MNQTRWAFILLAFASVAKAGAFIELVPDNTGPYSGGEEIAVDVVIRSDDTAPHDIRFVQWDLSQTDDAIALADGFQWDFSTIIGDDFHLVEVRYPLPSIVVHDFHGQVPGYMLELPAMGSLRSGRVVMTLPTAQGDYALDVLNSANTSQWQGSILHFGFGGSDRVTFWRGDGLGDDLLTGGQFTFRIVPEPATVAFLAFAAGLLLQPPRTRTGGNG